VNSETERAYKAALTARIRQCAEIAGSGASLARTAGIPRRTLENYLSGDNEPKASALAAIAKATGVDSRWLLYGEGEPQRAASPDRAPLDEQALTAAIAIVEGWIDDHRLRMSASKKAQVVTAIYEMYLEDQAAGRPPIDAARARPLLKLVAG